MHLIVMIRRSDHLNGNHTGCQRVYVNKRSEKPKFIARAEISGWIGLAANSVDYHLLQQVPVTCTSDVRKRHRREVRL